MTNPLITVVIPTYRRPVMLQRAIQSVLNQTFPNFRVCVYDNASGDSTATVVAAFQNRDSRVEYIGRPSNVGAYRNFVSGADAVRTPFFVFLPDDDMMLPQFFEIALAGFTRHPEAAMSILPTLHMSPGGFLLGAHVLQWPEEGLIKPPDAMLFSLRFGNAGLPAMLIRTEVWKEVGGFDEAVCPADDLDFELRVMAHMPVVVCKEPGAIQIIHPGSVTAAKGIDWIWPCVPRIVAKIAEDKGLSESARKEAGEILAGWVKSGLIIRGVMRSVSHGEWDEAKRAADIFQQVCGSARFGGIIGSIPGICKRVPIARLALRGVARTRTTIKALRNLELHWKFRTYSKIARASVSALPLDQG